MSQYKPFLVVHAAGEYFLQPVSLIFVYSRNFQRRVDRSGGCGDSNTGWYRCSRLCAPLCMDEVKQSAVQPLPLLCIAHLESLVVYTRLVLEQGICIEV